MDKLPSYCLVKYLQQQRGNYLPSIKDKFPKEGLKETSLYYLKNRRFRTQSFRVESKQAGYLTSTTFFILFDS